MVKLGKWIAVGLGWAFGGPIGALMGFFIGSFFDISSSASSSNRTVRDTQKGDFIITFLVLSAAVMKADKVVKKSELNFVKSFLITNFGKERTNEALKELKRLLETDIPLDEVCFQIRINMTTSLKLQILHYLFGIAAADGNIHTKEVYVIKEIAIKIGLSQQDFNSVRSMFDEQTNSAYEILGVSENATNEEIKTAYRRMAIKHHPDKVANMGEDIQKDAKQKFQTINEAYKRIKKERNLK